MGFEDKKMMKNNMGGGGGAFTWFEYQRI